MEILPGERFGEALDRFLKDKYHELRSLRQQLENAELEEKVRLIYKIDEMEKDYRYIRVNYVELSRGAVNPLIL